MKIVCLFPGIGYTCDKPLLYYSWKMFSSLGWKVVPVQYGGFPSGVKGNAKKMEKCAEMALKQAEELLKHIDWSEYESILFVSKSIGTVVAGAYSARHQIPCRHVLFTPVEATFSFGVKDAIVFHGTADPWADSDVIKNACRDAGLTLHVTRKANHSLETGDIDTDIDTLKVTMTIVRKYAEQVIKEATEYPCVTDAMAIRHQMYNHQMDDIDEREAFRESLVLRPPQSLQIRHTEKNPDELERVYQIGIQEAKKKLDEIQSFFAGGEA